MPRSQLFKPGKSGNPSGRPKGALSKKTFKRASVDCLNRISHAFFHEGVDGIKELASDATLTPVEKLCIAVMIKAVDRGDSNALTMILDRFIGRVRENVEIKTIQTDINDFRSLTDEEIMRRRQILISAGDE